ncbi:MAG: hypothetical protein LBG68_04670 [Coriobacteriales bacterium]|jgi:hypothetical protein|nr:hypothetical protein [Coriobacteriales bacterium]
MRTNHSSKGILAAFISFVLMTSGSLALAVPDAFDVDDAVIVDVSNVCAITEDGTEALDNISLSLEYHVIANGSEVDRGNWCCDPTTMRKVTINYDVHATFTNICSVTQYKQVICTYCGGVWETTIVGYYTHAPH